MNKLIQKINQFSRSLWIDYEIKEWYGIDLFQNLEFLEHFLKWANQYQRYLYKTCSENYSNRKDLLDALKFNKLPEIEQLMVSFKSYSRLKKQPTMEEIVLDGSLKWINRNFLELFLQTYDLITIKQAAIRWSMKDDDFLNIMENYIPQDQYLMPYTHIFSIQRLNLIWANLRTQFKYKAIGGNYMTFLNRLHEFFYKKFGLKIENIYCETSLKLRDNPTLLATAYDILSGAPMNMKYEIAFNNEKPLRLPPDKFSWITWARHEKEVAPYCLLTHFELPKTEKSKLKS